MVISQMSSINMYKAISHGLPWDQNIKVLVSHNRLYLQVWLRLWIYAWSRPIYCMLKRNINVLRYMLSPGGKTRRMRGLSKLYCLCYFSHKNIHLPTPSSFEIFTSNRFHLKLKPSDITTDLYCEHLIQLNMNNWNDRMLVVFVSINVRVSLCHLSTTTKTLINPKTSYETHI